jgi:ribosomal protein S17E
MEELLKAKARYESLMERMQEDMDLAEKYKADLESRYKTNAPLEQLVTIQSQVLRIQDYVTQKFNNLVEILRSYEELCNAIKEKEG